MAAIPALFLALLAAAPAAAQAANYVPGKVVIGYTAPPASSLQTAVARRMGVRSVAAQLTSTEQVVQLAPGVTVAEAIVQAGPGGRAERYVPRYYWIFAALRILVKEMG